MKELAIEIFDNYTNMVIFLHVLSAIIWVGGMIAIRVAVHPIMQSIDEPKIKLGKTIAIVGRLFNLVLPFIVILLFTALTMALMIERDSPMFRIAAYKELIWTIMTLNFAYMYIRRSQAAKLFASGDMAGAKAKIALFPNLLLPINIALGLVALYLGVVLRWAWLY